MNQRLMKEEYKIWKKNKPFLYDMVIIHTLKCLSFPIEWLPDQEEPPNKDYSIQKMICDTHIFVNEPTYLMLTQVQLPIEDVENSTRYYNDDLTDVGGFTFLVSIYVNSGQFFPSKDASTYPFDFHGDMWKPMVVPVGVDVVFHPQNLYDYGKRKITRLKDRGSSSNWENSSGGVDG